MGRSVVCFIPAVVATAIVAVPAADAFELRSSTLDGGGRTSSGGQYSLTGTIGQPDVGTSASGGFALQGGFWTSAGVPTSVEQDAQLRLPTVYHLYPNAPNPFNPTTVIRFDLPSPGRTDVRIFDLRGRLVRALVDEPLPAGRHGVTWDGRDRNGIEVSSGVYLLLMRSEHFTARRKMTMLK